MRIAVDMDDVLADTFGVQLDWLNREYGHALTPENMTGLDLLEWLPPAQVEHLVTMMQQGDIFADLPVMDHSQEVLRKLADANEIFIVTAAMEFPGSFGPKFRWLARHFPFIPPSRIVFCGDKSIVSVDTLIDDMPRNLAHLDGRGILFTAPHNAHLTGYRRATGWREVERLLVPESSALDAPPAAPALPALQELPELARTA
ncbi:5' nucleotidase, NT5C type [Pendulispora albinea]|uniref:Uncharacterized protein n=1 Tax=Pendulispora albinea TaxID=2741071 RepID=A0ABZ2M4K1_9BACT